MESTQSILTDEQINQAWGNANFGANTVKRDIIAGALLQINAGYAEGHTIKVICRELGLLKGAAGNISTTKKGNFYLFHYFRPFLNK